MVRPIKNGIISFKVDDALAEAMAGVANRSEFIRTSVLAALDHVCPLCHGTGILTPNQRRHWEDFALRHERTRCRDCDEVVLVCKKTPPRRGKRISGGL